MINKNLIFLILATSLFAGTVLPQDPSRLPQVTPDRETHTLTPEDVLSIREVRQLHLSPDGKLVAFRVREPSDPRQPRAQQTTNIWVASTDGKDPVHPLLPKLQNASSPRWSPDGRWLAFLSDHEKSNRDIGGTTQVYLLRRDGSEAERLTSISGGVQDFKWSGDSSTIACIARDQPTTAELEKQTSGDDEIEVDSSNFRYSRLWTVSVSDHKTVQLTKQNFEIREFAWSPAGDEIALAVAKTPAPEDSLLWSLIVVNSSTGDVKRTLSRNAASITGVLRWSPDGALITFLEGPPTKEFASWLAVVPAKGGSVRPLLKKYNGTVLVAEWTRDSNHLLAQSIEGTRQALLKIDIDTGRTHRLADVTQTIWEYSFSSNGETIAYTAQTPESPSDIWVWTKDEQPKKITDFNPQTRSWRLGKVREVEWKNSKDGLLRRGVLITPPDYKVGRPYPTIVNTHPGDTAWWIGLHAKWWAWGHILASRGYVVFLPNTRGVNGEGWRLHATIAEWGGMAYQDLADGVDYLVQQKIADPNRLGIGGWSNGGFMTEYAITRSARFKAAVALAGHSDFFSLYGTSYIRHSLRVSIPHSPYYNRKSYDNASPITLVQNCRTPTLLMHGIDDPGVPVGQAYEFHTALKDAGVETKLIIYPREGHSIQEYGHQLDVQQRVIAWFDKHLKP